MGNTLSQLYGIHQKYQEYMDFRQMKHHNISSLQKQIQEAAWTKGCDHELVQYITNIHHWKVKEGLYYENCILAENCVRAASKDANKNIYTLCSVDGQISLFSYCIECVNIVCMPYNSL